MKQRTRLLLLALASTAVSLALAELGLRLFAGAAGAPYYECFFEDREQQPIDFAKAARQGGITPWPNPFRAHQASFSPGFEFSICYRHSKAPWLDARGCVPVRINSVGVRDRDEITAAKPPGQKRILCLGDSFTFGWGVHVEKVWDKADRAGSKTFRKLAFHQLRRCGWSLHDEYWARLRDHFYQLGPDVVLVSICLNDVALIPDTIALHRAPLRPSLFGLDLRKASVILDRALGAYDRTNIVSLDPGVDYGRKLLAQTNLDPVALAIYKSKSQVPDAVWPAGAPQEALRQLKAWCHARGIQLRVVLWPLMQGFGAGDTYPFQTLHDVVRDFCSKEEIPMHDLLPCFSGRDPQQFWVDPCDEHPNEKANALVAPAIARFLIESGAVR
jgi:lysophospholipase L1-like esterase